MDVLATVYDAGLMPPGRGDTLFVDTNVWVDLVHPAAHPGPGSDRSVWFGVYSQVVASVRSGGGTLQYGALALNELGHVIERVEWKVSPVWKKASPKAFRRDPAERARVLGLIRTAFRQVEAIAVEVPMAVDYGLTIAVVDRAVREQHALDVYDMYFVEAARPADAVLTDDADFATVDGLALVTANPSVIAAARAEGALRDWPPVGVEL